ncbi:MAG: anaerobic sulfatase maturase [Sphaerochaetaceae bacterium]|nr:anaerobic sulfatase maturase [Sphaerochaetaceae bacterium]
MEMRKPLSFLLVKPAGPDCNLACKYCFYSCKDEYFGSGTRHRMSFDTLEIMIRQALGRPGAAMSFGWQGGEPTLAGLDSFKQAVELQTQYGKGMRVSNSLQTNGILIDQGWIDFLKKYSFLIGLSIDGPEHVHDHYRLDFAGKGSHHKVEQVAKEMLANDVAVNAISVVNNYSAQYGKETYEYLKSLGFTYLQFIPCVETDPTGKRQAADFSVTPQQYGKFLCDVFDLWEKDVRNGVPTISIRGFDNYLGMYLGYESTECVFKHTCGDYLVVEHTGEIYSCDFFVEDAWRLGDITKNGNMEEMLNGKRQQLFSRMKAKVPDKCLKCEWRPMCHGGCTKDRLRDPRDKRMSHFCESYKMFHAYSSKRFIEIAKEFKKHH